MAYKLPNPERERTERNRELKRLRRPDEEDRIERAATLMLAFHEEREVNHVMELAQLIMEEDADGAQTMLRTYLDEVDTTEDRMERLAMLANVGRWIGDDDLETTARDRAVHEAVQWVNAVSDEIDRLDRVSTVERRFDEDFRRRVQDHLS